MTQQEFQTRYKYNPSTDCVGEGGFGKVYKAYDTHLDKWVAIKVAEVKPGQEQVRLKREVEMVSKLPTHANIANYEACHTFSSFTGEYDFAVLQYYENGNLQQLIDSGKLNQTQKETLLRQILEGIRFLHNQDIIHRDLKPQNILIAKRNDEYIPKITDFGISKKLDFNKSSVFTNSLAGAGTMAYASPEQLLCKTIKKNTDLWSFGVIVCQVFTGKLPFSIGRDGINSEAGRIELYKQIVNGTVSFSNNSIPAKWQQLIKQCIVVDNNIRATKAEICFGFVKDNNQFIYDNNCESDLNNENSFRITVENGLSGFEDSTGLKITDVKYEDVHPFCEGLAAVQLNKKWGFIDIYGNEIIPNIYNKVIDFSNGLSCVIKDNKELGYINRQNIEVIPIVFELPLFPDNSLIIKFKDVWSVINSKLKFSENLVAIKFNNKFGFFNNHGEQVIPFIYDNATNFSCGLACVKLNGKWGYINKSGKIIIEIKYDKVSTFTNGVAIVSIKDKYWHINETGNELYKIRYDRVFFFSENLARVVLKRKYGYIDLNGDVIIPLQYNFASDFCDGKALVTFEGVSGHIDIKGEREFSFAFELNRFSKKSIVSESDNYRNLIPLNNFLVPPKKK